LSGGALLAHVFHAGREARGPAASEDERVCVLQASKAEMEALAAALAKAQVPFKACVETDGPMAGSTPSLGFALRASDKEWFRDLVGHLKVWR
jgi:hypothetical protein